MGPALEALLTPGLVSTVTSVLCAYWNSGSIAFAAMQAQIKQKLRQTVS